MLALVHPGSPSGSVHADRNRRSLAQIDLACVLSGPPHSFTHTVDIRCSLTESFVFSIYELDTFFFEAVRRLLPLYVRSAYTFVTLQSVLVAGHFFTFCPACHPIISSLSEVTQPESHCSTRCIWRETANFSPPETSTLRQPIEAISKQDRACMYSYSSTS